LSPLRAAFALLAAFFAPFAPFDAGFGGIFQLQLALNNIRRISAENDARQ